MSNIIPFTKPYREHVSPALDAGLIAVQVGRGYFWKDFEKFLEMNRRKREEIEGGDNDA